MSQRTYRHRESRCVHCDKKLNAATGIDPAALVPGQRVRLYAEDIEREGIPQDRVWNFAGNLGRQYLYGFECGDIVLGLMALDDGTLRDDEGRIVEVRDAS